MAISMLKIRRPLGRLIFNMGIAIPGKTVFLIETAPRWKLLSEEYNIILGVTVIRITDTDITPLGSLCVYDLFRASIH